MFTFTKEDQHYTKVPSNKYKLFWESAFYIAVDKMIKVAIMGRRFFQLKESQNKQTNKILWKIK